MLGKESNLLFPWYANGFTSLRSAKILLSSRAEECGCVQKISLLS